MNKSFLQLVVLYCAISYNSYVFGQNRSSDSLQLHQLEANITNGFNKAMGKQAGLYNGPEFIPYGFVSPTNANFKDSVTFVIGNVNYDGVLYTNVPLIYDLHQELLITRLHNGFTSYSLLNEKIDNFDMFDHHFVRFQPDDINRIMAAGFYDELYNNKLQLLAKRYKDLQEEHLEFTITNVFSEKNTYFLKKENKYYRVQNSSDFLKVLRNKKNELKKYVKDNKLDFRKNRERSMIMLVSYYDKITN